MTQINIDSLEPNSHKYKAEKAQDGKSEKRDKVQPVIDRDQIVSTKKPLGKKFAETFMSGTDTNDIKKWLLEDIIIPGIKNTILDALSMKFFGEPAYRSGRRSSRRDDRYDYRSCYNGQSNGRRYKNSRCRDDERYDSDDHVDFRNIILKNRDDAERVINALRNRIRDDGSASVADLLDLIDVAGRYTDNNYGWDDERDIGIRRVSTGYLIDVAEPKYLN